MLEFEGCIAAMITTERYHHEKNNGGITWFYPSGWAVNGMPGMIRLFNLDCMIDEGYAPEYFLKSCLTAFPDASSSTQVSIVSNNVERTRSNSAALSIYGTKASRVRST